jgi:hypothetical protein
MHSQITAAVGAEVADNFGILLPLDVEIDASCVRLKYDVDWVND